jgi:adhesin/invasin
MYPQTINAEYLVPMSRVIEDAITANDPTAIAQYASGIAQEIAVGLIKKAYAAMDAAPRVSSITGAATTDNAAADSTAPNTVKFTAMDQNGAPMAGVPLVFSSSSGTTPLTPASGDTAGDGTLSVDLINSVAETVTVTATSGAVSGVADVTFTEPVAAREGRRHG